MKRSMLVGSVCAATCCMAMTASAGVVGWWRFNGEGANVESSLLATANCKELGVGTVIAKATSELHGKILEKLGADQVIFPDRESARRLARCITGGEAPSPASEES